jgi:hypothetical protein
MDAAPSVKVSRISWDTAVTSSRYSYRFSQTDAHFPRVHLTKQVQNERDIVREIKHVLIAMLTKVPIPLIPDTSGIKEIKKSV